MTAHSCGSLFTLLFLLVLFPCDEDGIASEAPVVEVYFVDDDDGAGRVLVKNIDEKVSGAFDEGGFLFLCDVAFLCNFNVDVWHSLPPSTGRKKEMFCLYFIVRTVSGKGEERELKTFLFLYRST
jgi:hypothetical protein